MRSAVLLAAVILAGGARAADDAAVAVVKKGVEALGGEAALKKHPAAEYKVEGDVTIQGEKGTFKSTISYALPDRFRMNVETTLGTTTSTQVVVVNGDKVKATVNGKATTPKAEAKAEFFQLSALQEVSMLYPLLDDKKFTLKAEKDETVNGVEAAVVLVTRPEAKEKEPKLPPMKEVKLYFDKKSGLPVRFVHKMPDPLGVEVPTEVTNADFKKFGDIMYPTVQTVKQAGKEYMVLKLLDVKMVDKPDLRAFNAD